MRDPPSYSHPAGRARRQLPAERCASRSPSRSSMTLLPLHELQEALGRSWGTANGRARTTAIRVLEGRELLRTYQPAEGTAKTFCSVCGSNLFGGGWPESELASVRLSAIDSPFDQRPEAHTYVQSVAPWETLPEDGLDASTSGRRRHGRRIPAQPGTVPYAEALELQRSLAGAVSQGAIPETVILLEHPPVVTLGRRTELDREVHVPSDADGRDRRDRPRRQVDVPRPGPARLLPDPRPEAAREGRAQVRPRPRGGAHPHARRIRPPGRPDRGLTGVWMPPPRRGRPAEDRLDRRPRHPLGDDARLRAQRRPRRGAVHGMDHRLRARGRRVHDDGVRAGPAARCRRRQARGRAALAEVFGLELEPLPAEDGAGLWPQPVHAGLAER